MRKVSMCAAAVIVSAWLSAPIAASPPEPTEPSPTEESNQPADVDIESPATLPLVPVPTGCTAPPTPHIVFVGEVIDADYRTVRFEIERIRAGAPAPFADGNRIDVRYGIDAQYLDDGDRYLVSAVVDPDLGVLVSRVTAPIENFGGDDVIGVSESDVDCRDFEDPVRTLELDGTPVPASVIEPFASARVQLLGAVLLPFGVAFGVIFVLATLRLSVSGLYRSVTDSGRDAR